MASKTQTTASSARIPCATYRLQFNRQFTLRDALELVPYLYELGISDVYASPLFQACGDSTHGYDVCDFTRLSPCLGTEEDFADLASALRERGMGLLVDMVPNHMGIGDAANLWWQDVLEHGPESAFADFFDIDWRSNVPGLHGKVLLPILGDQFDSVLNRGEIKLARIGTAIRITYFDHSFPISAAGLDYIIHRCGEKMASQAALDRLNAPEELRQLLELQYYRLAWWRAAARELNYRRFFDVTGLAGLRVELPKVFSASHAQLFRWLAERKVTGVRVDHPDGLLEPEEYFRRLQETFAGHTSAAPGDPKPLYVVAEKILSPGERLPNGWLVYGTTGYDFLGELNAIFVNSGNADAFDAIFSTFAGEKLDFDEVVYSRKQLILETTLRAEADGLARRLAKLARDRGRQITPEDCSRAIIGIIAALPVYRTYVSAGHPKLSGADKEYMSQAVHRAKERNAGADPSLLEFVAALFASPNDPAAMEFVQRFQQLSGPATAKGVEDTSFYVYNRLVSLNEVGGDPARFGAAIEEFHEQNRARLQHWPHSMLATSTHDTKRGEDTRARINVLSEFPGEWREATARWRAMNAGKKKVINGVSMPDGNDEYLIYQTLVGAWPAEAQPDFSLFLPRMKSYVLKAAKESKRHTTWIDPHEEYERALVEFVEHLLDPAGAFMQSFQQFQKKIGYFGRFNSLAQALLKFTCPGVPDVYQGSELWNLSLVDPDNRDSVNYAARRRMLSELMQELQSDRARLIRELASAGFSERAKLFVTHQALQFRRAHEMLFRDGDYVPLRAQGALAEHVCAFTRTHKTGSAIVCAPIFTATLTKGAEAPPLAENVWKDCNLFLPATLNCSKLENIFTGEVFKVQKLGSSLFVMLKDIFQLFPVSLFKCHDG